MVLSGNSCHETEPLHLYQSPQESTAGICSWIDILTPSVIWLSMGCDLWWVLTQISMMLIGPVASLKSLVLSTRWRFCSKDVQYPYSSRLPWKCQGVAMPFRSFFGYLVHEGVLLRIWSLQTSGGPTTESAAIQWPQDPVCEERLLSLTPLLVPALLTVGILSSALLVGVSVTVSSWISSLAQHFLLGLEKKVQRLAALLLRSGGFKV